MSETEVDLRGYRLVLVGHSVLNADPATPGSGARANAAVLDWAADSGYGVYQLPAPAHTLMPEQTSTEVLVELAAEDREALDFVFGQVRVYLDNGYELVGVVLLERETTSAGAQEWLHSLTASASEARIDLRRVWRLPSDSEGRFDPNDPRLRYQLEASGTSS